MNRVLRTGAALIAATALGVGTFAVAALPAEAAPACNITFKTYPTVKTGSTGARVTAAECLLRSAGYSVVVNGSFSARESAAVAKFQTAKKQKSTGTVDKAAWTALLARGSTPKLYKGKRGDDVKRLQRALTASGRPVAVTGTFGTQTANAVKTIQRAKGWKQSGVAGSGTWWALQTGKAASMKITAAKKSSSKSKGAKALAFAKKQLGERYRYGAAGPNAWDCSGLTMKAWAAAGVKLPHNARAQFKRGKKIAKKDLRPGDLVFFYPGISHVGIYAGNGNVVNATRPGTPVGYTKIKYMPYQGARRPG